MQTRHTNVDVSMLGGIPQWRGIDWCQDLLPLFHRWSKGYRQSACNFKKSMGKPLSQMTQKPFSHYRANPRGINPHRLISDWCPCALHHQDLFWNEGLLTALKSGWGTICNGWSVTEPELTRGDGGLPPPMLGSIFMLVIMQFGAYYGVGTLTRAYEGGGGLPPPMLGSISMLVIMPFGAYYGVGTLHQLLKCTLRVRKSIQDLWKRVLSCDPFFGGRGGDMMEVSMKEFDGYLSASHHHLTWNPDIIYSLISFQVKSYFFRKTVFVSHRA